MTKEKRIKEKAIEAMIELGIAADTKGFTYIAEAMEFLDAEEDMRFRIYKLYGEIAKRHEGATTNKVERAIRHAFTMVQTYAPMETMEKWITNVGKTSNGNLLAIFYLRLKKTEEA